MQKHRAAVPPARHKAEDPAAEADQTWFEDHPGTDHYTRETIPGEFESVVMTPSHVQVVRVAPGIRKRYPLWTDPAPGEPRLVQPTVPV